MKTASKLLIALLAVIIIKALCVVAYVKPIGIQETKTSSGSKTTIRLNSSEQQAPARAD
jgi:hypothetical protein